MRLPSEATMAGQPSVSRAQAYFARLVLTSDDVRESARESGISRKRGCVVALVTV